MRRAGTAMMPDADRGGNMFVFQLAQMQQKRPEELFAGGVTKLQGQQAQQIAQMLKENYSVMHAAMMGKG